MLRILIIGAGITGSSLCFNMTKNKIGKFYCILWDKANGAGGRMATKRMKDNENCFVDIGAQYISSTPHAYAINSRYYSLLCENNVLSPMENYTFENGFQRYCEGTRFFTAPLGMNSISKYFLKESSFQQYFNRHVSSVRLSEDGKSWNVFYNNDIAFETVNALVLTMPVPQILQLGGDMPMLLESQPEVYAKLKKVVYSSRYALALFFDDGTQLPYQWSVKYVSSNPCICYISIENRKRNSPNLPVGICVHTSVSWSLPHISNDTSSADIQRQVMDSLREILPDLPTPRQIVCHKWRYSQVFQAYDANESNCSSTGALLLHKSPILALAGDAFTHSNFDGCLVSSNKAAQFLENVLF